MALKKAARLGRGWTNSDVSNNSPPMNGAPSVAAASRVAAAAAAAAAQIGSDQYAAPNRSTDEEKQVFFDVIKVNRFGIGQRRVLVFEYRNRGVSANSSKNPSLLEGSLLVFGEKGVLKHRILPMEIKSLAVVETEVIRMGTAASGGSGKVTTRTIYFAKGDEVESFVRIALRLNPDIPISRYDLHLTPPTKNDDDENDTNSPTWTPENGPPGMQGFSGGHGALGINSMALQPISKSRWSKRFYCERFNMYGQPEGCVILLSEGLQIFQLRGTARDDVLSAYELKELHNVTQFGVRGRGLGLKFLPNTKSQMQARKVDGGRGGTGTRKRHAFVGGFVVEFLLFDSAAARNELMQSLSEQPDSSMVPLHSANQFSPEAEIHGMMAGWVKIPVAKIRGVTRQLKSRRWIFAINVFKGIVQLFDIPSGEINDRSEPYSVYLLSDEALTVHCDIVSKSLMRLKMTIVRKTQRRTVSGNVDLDSGPSGGVAHTGGGSGADKRPRVESGQALVNGSTHGKAKDDNHTVMEDSSPKREIAVSNLSDISAPPPITARKGSDTAAAGGTSSIVKEVLDITFHNSADRAQFLAYMHGAITTSEPSLELLPEALRKVRTRIKSPTDSVKCSAATLGNKAWAAVEQTWPSAKHDVYVGTFNVGDQAPPSSDLLQHWVARPGTPNSPTFAMYAFGFQESATKFDEWVKALGVHLGSGYTPVRSCRLWEIALVVFVSVGEAQYVSNVEHASEATGMGIAKDVTGVQLGNKGAVAIGLTWHDVSFCFVNAHFAAKQDRIRVRNENFSQIVSKLPLSYAAGRGEGMELTHGYEHCFFFGDLNYRVEMGFKKVVQIAAKGGWAALHKEDQLMREMNAGRAFYGWTTAPPMFIPSYRWERGRMEFSNKKDQPPSYTDRVLWRSRHGQENAVELLKYFCAEDVTISDHRPVAAHIRMRVRHRYMWPLHPLVDATKVRDPTEAHLSTTGIDTPPRLLGSKRLTRGLGSGEATFRLESRDWRGPTINKSKINLGGSFGGSFGSIGNGSIDDDEDGTGSGSVGVASLTLGRSLRRGNMNGNNKDDDTGPSLTLGRSMRRNKKTNGKSVSFQPSHLTDDDASAGPPPQAWFAADGSFFLTARDAATDGAPEVRLRRVRLHLSQREGTQLPQWTTLHIRSSILHDDENTLPMLGSEHDPDSGDVVRGNSTHGTDKGWSDMYFAWDDDFAIPRLKPTIWDPCYLVTQHLMISVETAQQPRSGGGFQHETADLSGTAGGDGDGDATIAATDSRGGGGERGGGAPFFFKTSVAGLTAVSLQDTVEAVRRLVANYGVGAWERDSAPCVPFTEPVMLGGIQVGTLSGELQLLPVSQEMLRKRVRGAMGADASNGDVDNPSVLKLAKQGFVRVHGIEKNKRVKRQGGWHHVTLMLTSGGLLYLLSRPHNVESRKPPRRGVLQKLNVVNAKIQVLRPNFKLLPDNKEQFVFSVTAAVPVGSDTFLTARGGGPTTTDMFIVALASEREKLDWLQAFEAVKSAKTAKFVPMKSTRRLFQKKGASQHFGSSETLTKDEGKSRGGTGGRRDADSSIEKNKTVQNQRNNKMGSLGRKGQQASAVIFKKKEKEGTLKRVKEATENESESDTDATSSISDKNKKKKDGGKALNSGVVPPPVPPSRFRLRGSSTTKDEGSNSSGRPNGSINSTNTSKSKSTTTSTFKRLGRQKLHLASTSNTNNSKHLKARSEVASSVDVSSEGTNADNSNDTSKRRSSMADTARALKSMSNTKSKPPAKDGHVVDMTSPFGRRLSSPTSTPGESVSGGAWGDRGDHKIKQEHKRSGSRRTSKRKSGKTRTAGSGSVPGCPGSLKTTLRSRAKANALKPKSE